MVYEVKRGGLLQGILLVWLTWSICAADIGPTWPSRLPEFEVSISSGRNMVAGADSLADVEVWRYSRGLGVHRGWTSEDMGFGGTQECLLPAGIRRKRDPWPPLVELPGMRVETDYEVVAGAGRRRIPGGAAALAAAGLMVFAARKW